MGVISPARFKLFQAAFERTCLASCSFDCAVTGLSSMTGHLMKRTRCGPSALWGTQGALEKFVHSYGLGQSGRSVPYVQPASMAWLTCQR